GRVVHSSSSRRMTSKPTEPILVRGPILKSSPSGRTFQREKLETSEWLRPRRGTHHAEIAAEAGACDRHRLHRTWGRAERNGLRGHRAPAKQRRHPPAEGGRRELLQGEEQVAEGGGLRRRP